VDFNGIELLQNDYAAIATQATAAQASADDASFESEVRDALNGKPLSAKELLKKLNLTCTAQKLNSDLKKLDFIEVAKEKKGNLYKLKGRAEVTQPSLFD